MQIETTRFGPIEVADDTIISFPRGLYGLDRARSYCLLAREDQGCFHWLQAADAPPIAMVVTDPFSFFPDYQVEIPDTAAELLQAADSSDVSIYTTLTIAAEEDRVYTNLLGPLVINHRTGLGLQVIQDAARYQTRHLLPVVRRRPPGGSAAQGAPTAGSDASRLTPHPTPC
jgi:flagellar assembly factor FliW